MTGAVADSRWPLFWRCARNNAQTAACTVLGSALAEGRVPPALVGWATVLAIAVTLAQTLTRTCPRWYW